MKLGSLKINFRRFGILIAICLVLILVMNFNTRLGELSRLQNQAATVRSQATGVITTQEALQTQVGWATSPAAVEAFARSEAHLGQPDDNVLIVVPVPGYTPLPSPTPTPIVNDTSPLDVWLIFIFGK